MGGYAYAADNPATSSDPTGLCDTLGCPPPHVHGHEPAHGGPAAPGGGYPVSGGDPAPASPGGTTYQPGSCSHLSVDCGGYIPPVFDEVPGGSLGFLAGLGGSLAGTVGLAQCALNPLLCALQQATGTDPSGLYTGWVHSQGISTSSHSTYNGGLWAGAALQMAAGGLLGAGGAAADAGATTAEGAGATRVAATGNDLLRPGPWAADSVPSSSPGVITQAERDALNPIGEESGCHSCGATSPGTKSGNWVGDHQPPSRIAPFGTPQVLYPQCMACSNEQGLWIINLIRQGLL